jgi:hypothetical protein
MFCTYFARDVELTQEREKHIALKHSSLLPLYRHLLDDVLLNPDLIRLSPRTPKAFEFSRWYGDLLGGKHVVVSLFTILNDFGLLLRT